MRHVLLLVAVWSLAGAAQAREREALKAFLLERQGPLAERVREAESGLEADQPGDGPARAVWAERLGALQREWELLERLQARSQASPKPALDGLGDQLTRLEAALRLRVPPSEAPPPPGCDTSGRAPSATGRITGTVRRTDTSAPVAGVAVVVYGCTGSYVAVDTTDGSGFYDTGAVLPTGQYYLLIDSNSSGLVNEIYPDVVCFACSPRVGSPVSVSDGATTAGIDFALTPGAVFQGSVHDSVGGGISSAVLVATPDGHLDLVTNTDGTGAFTTGSGAPPGDYILATFTSGNFVNECYPGDLPCPYPFWYGDNGLPRFTVTGPGTITGINIVLAAGAQVTGRVVDSGLNPLIGVSVVAGPEDGITYCSATTDAAGTYACKGLPSGAHVLRASKAGHITQLYPGIPCVGCSTRGGQALQLLAGVSSPLADVVLATEGAITGTVHHGSGPGAPAIPGATVTAHGVKGVSLASATTDATGAYRIGRLTSGSYLLKVTAPGFLQGLSGVGSCPGCAVTAGASVAVTAGLTASAGDIPLAPAASLTGIVSASTGPLLASVTVRAYDVTGRLLGQASSDCTGRYRIEGLEAGSYYVQTLNTLGYVDEAAGGVQCFTCTPVTGTTVALTAGVTTTLDFALDAGGRLTGRLTNFATGRGLFGQTVLVYDSLGALQTSTSTDELGRYGTRALPPGNYRLLVNASDRYRRQPYGSPPCDLSCSPLVGALIAVGSSAATADMALQRGGGISGRVLSFSSGTPVGSSVVEVYNSAGAFVDYATSSYSGHWATKLGLPADTYYAVNDGASGFLPRRYPSGDCFPLSACAPLSGSPISVSGAGVTATSPFSLTQAARLFGRVSIGNSWPASNVVVEVYSATGALVSATSAEPSSLFRMPIGFPAGNYFVRSRASSLGYLDSIYAGLLCTALSCNVTSGTPVALPGSGGVFVNLGIGAGRARKGDFNKDLSTDLVLRNLTTNAHRYWLMNGTSLALQGDFTPTTPGPNLAVTGVDDFDRDGFNDLALWNSSTGAVEVWLMGGGAGVSRLGSPVPLVTPPPAPPWRLSSTADFNRDGAPDLLWRNSSTQKIEIWRMNGVTRVGISVPNPDQAVDANWEIVATLDWNGDGYVDFLWYNPVSGKIVLWFMDASYKRVTGMFTTPPNAGANNWKVVAGGDYGVGTGGLPGTIDIVWRNGTSGKLVVWHMNQHGTRTFGTFTTPDGPTPPLDWTVVGPR